MQLLLDRCVRRSDLVKELWRDSHAQAMGARDLEEYLLELQDVVRLQQHTFGSLKASFFAQELDNGEVAGRAFKKAVEQTQKLLQLLPPLIDHWKKQGYAISCEDQVHALITHIERLKSESERLWPPLDRGQVERALDEFRRGEYDSVEDLLHAAQGRAPQERQ